MILLYNQEKGESKIKVIHFTFLKANFFMFHINCIIIVKKG